MEQVEGRWEWVAASKNFGIFKSFHDNNLFDFLFNDTPTLVGHFVLSQKGQEKRNRGACRRETNKGG